MKRISLGQYAFLLVALSCLIFLASVIPSNSDIGFYILSLPFTVLLIVLASMAAMQGIKRGWVVPGAIVFLSMIGIAALYIFALITAVSVAETPTEDLGLIDYIDYLNVAIIIIQLQGALYLTTLCFIAICLLAPNPENNLSRSGTVFTYLSLGSALMSLVFGLLFVFNFTDSDKGLAIAILSTVITALFFALTGFFRLEARKQFNSDSIIYFNEENKSQTDLSKPIIHPNSDTNLSQTSHSRTAGLDNISKDFSSGQDSHIAPEPGWYPDPMKQSNLRYWDGVNWTEDSREKNARGEAS